MIDKELLLEECDVRTVAEYIGMDVAKRGSKYSILCPEHNDGNFGNCYLTPKGYICYACGAKGDAYKLVMKHTDCSFSEALNIVAECSGGKELFDTIEYNENEQLPLTAEELNTIGLTTGSNMLYVKNTLSEIDEKDNEKRYQKVNGEILEFEKGSLYSLSSIYVKNRKLYNYIVLMAAKESVLYYKKLIEEYGDRDSLGAGKIYELFNIDGTLDSDIFHGIKRELIKKFEISKKIYLEYKEEKSAH